LRIDRWCRHYALLAPLDRAVAIKRLKQKMLAEGFGGKQVDVALWPDREAVVEAGEPLVFPLDVSPADHSKQIAKMQRDKNNCDRR
jgi:hypothetical protein